MKLAPGVQIHVYTICALILSGRQIGQTNRIECKPALKRTQEEQPLWSYGKTALCDCLITRQ